MRGVVLLGVVMLTLAGCGDGTESGARATTTDAGSVEAESMNGMILHLPDGPEAAMVGDDSHCGGELDTEGDGDEFLDLVMEARKGIEGCFIQLEAPETTVDSLVLSFPSEELAEQVLTADVFSGVIRYYGLDCCNAEPVGTLTEAAGPGEEALAAVSASDTSAVHGWREGSLVGAVSVIRFDGKPGAAAEAARLAGVQHERMLQPVVTTDDVDEDRLVGLEQAPFTPWWLGETFSPIGFPPMDLYMSYFQDGMVELDYHGALIQVFDLSSVPSGSTPDQMLAVTAELFDSPCTVTEPIDGPGTSLLLGRHVPGEFFTAPSGEMRNGWGELTTGDCPAGDPNVWMASAEVDDLYIRVNPALCYNCLDPPTSAFPFHTPDGLRNIVAALVPFES